jgi:hypothetical protein
MMSCSPSVHIKAGATGPACRPVLLLSPAQMACKVQNCRWLERGFMEKPYAKCSAPGRLWAVSPAIVAAAMPAVAMVAVPNDYPVPVPLAKPVSSRSELHSL